MARRPLVDGLKTAEEVHPDLAKKFVYGDKAALSANGHVVAFSSPATNLVPGDTNATRSCFFCGTDIFVRIR